MLCLLLTTSAHELFYHTSYNMTFWRRFLDAIKCWTRPVFENFKMWYSDPATDTSKWTIIKFLYVKCLAWNQLSFMVTILSVRGVGTTRWLHTERPAYGPFKQTLCTPTVQGGNRPTCSTMQLSALGVFTGTFWQQRFSVPSKAQFNKSTGKTSALCAPVQDFWGFWDPETLASSHTARL